MNLPEIDHQLLDRLRAEPETPLDVLVRVERADKATQSALQDLGLTVRRRLRLVSYFAVSGPGFALLRLLDEQWVQGIEPDQPVHTTSTFRSTRPDRSE